MNDAATLREMVKALINPRDRRLAWSVPVARPGILERRSFSAPEDNSPAGPIYLGGGSAMLVRAIGFGFQSGLNPVPDSEWVNMQSSTVMRFLNSGIQREAAALEAYGPTGCLFPTTPIVVESAWELRVDRATFPVEVAMLVIIGQMRNPDEAVWRSARRY